MSSFKCFVSFDKSFCHMKSIWNTDIYIKDKNLKNLKTKYKLEKIFQD